MTTVDPLAQAAMVAYCGWDPTAVVANATVLLDGNYTEVVLLPSLHVTAVSAVSVTLMDGTVHTLQIGMGLDVAWGEDGVLSWLPTNILGGAYWPGGRQNISVTYSGGYATIPSNLLAALDSLTARMPRVTSGLTSAKIGTAAMTYAAQLAQGGLLLVEQMVFDNYRIVRVA